MEVFENRFGQIVEKSFESVLCLFGFVKAAKFRDLSEYSDCVQNVWAKSCLPCQILYIKQKKFCRARKSLGTSLALQCYPVLVSSGFLCSKIAWEKQETKVDYSFFSFLLFTLFLFNKSVCSLWLGAKKTCMNNRSRITMFVEEIAHFLWF